LLLKKRNSNKKILIKIFDFQFLSKLYIYIDARVCIKCSNHRFKIAREPVVIFQKVPNMSRDMFIFFKTTPMDGFSENEPVYVKFTLYMF